jgi:apolipoprotein N-acyltransferase
LPRRNIRLGWLAPIAGGLAGALAFDPFGLAFLIPLFPLGMFIGMRLAPDPRGAFLRGLAGGFVFYMIAISWLLTLGRFFPIVVAGIVIAASYLTLFPAVSAWALRRWLAPLPVSWHFAAFAAFWLLAEWARTLGELAVPMVQVGHAWAGRPRLVQIAEFFGEAGVNAQVLLISGALLAIAQTVASLLKVALAPDSNDPSATDLLVARGPSTLQHAAAAASLVGLSALLMMFSAWRANTWSERLDYDASTASLRVALVQPSISQHEKVESVAEPDESKRQALVEAHTRVLEELVAGEVGPDVDLVVFPESAYTDLLFALDRQMRDRVRQMMAPTGADLLTGATRVGLDAEGRRIERVWNSAWFVPADGGPWESYDKIRLVPFGENLSYFRYIPFLTTIVPVGEFDRGKVMTVFQTRGVPFSSIICFESYFGAQTRLAARRGARFIVLVTNDGWYGRSAGPYQHHDQSILRAIETRRPVVRSAYTGISALIDSAGRVHGDLGIDRRGVLTGTIKPQSHVTFFVRWGNLWLIGASALLLGGLFVRMRRASA